MSDIRTPDALNTLLDALGEHLARVGAPTHLVVIGGSGLLAIGVGQRATQDVDVLAVVLEGELVSARPLPPEVATAATLVARDFRLAPDWLNPGPTDLLLSAGPPTGFTERLHTRDYGPALQVSFAARLDQIHFKLYALADRNIPRDEADLRLLNPTAAELRAAARWVQAHNMPGPFDDQLAAALRSFGVEDAGRDA